VETVGGELRRQMAFDWDSFDVGDSSFTAAPARVDLSSEWMRSQSRCDDIWDVMRNSSRSLTDSSGLAQRRSMLDDTADDSLL